MYRKVDVLKDENKVLSDVISTYMEAHKHDSKDMQAKLDDDKKITEFLSTIQGNILTPVKTLIIYS